MLASPGGADHPSQLFGPRGAGTDGSDVQPPRDMWEVAFTPGAHGRSDNHSSLAESTADDLDDALSAADQVTLDEEGRIKVGAPVSLVARLADPAVGSLDAHYCAVLLLTYRAFFTPLEMLAALVTRFHVAPTPRVAASAVLLPRWEAEVQRPVQLLVCSAVQKWLQLYMYAEELDAQLLAAFEAFLEGPLAPLPPLQGRVAQSLAAAQARLEGGASYGEQHAPREVGAPPPACLFTEPSFSPFDRIDSVDPLEWARQLTLLEARLFGRLEPRELLRCAWSKSDKHARAPHVLELTAHFNRVADWVASSVLAPSDVADRAHAFAHAVRLAWACYKLNSFNAVFEVVAGLEQCAVHRLKQTKQQLPAREQKQLEQMLALVSTDNNRKAYRQALRQARPPCIPYLGVYLTDLTFLEEGNPDTVKIDSSADGGEPLVLINWPKHERYAATLAEIRSYQKTHYNLATCCALQTYLTTQMPNFVLDSNEQYDRSLQLEQRVAAQHHNQDDREVLRAQRKLRTDALNSLRRPIASKAAVWPAMAWHAAPLKHHARCAPHPRSHAPASGSAAAHAIDSVLEVLLPHDHHRYGGSSWSSLGSSSAKPDKSTAAGGGGGGGGGGGFFASLFGSSSPPARHVY